ncbi:MAG: Gfo/Idh/MocA family protein [Promethearchaeota archaeon]
MKLNVTIVGAGMIVNDQILPSIYHLQRLGIIGKIKICAVHSRSLKRLANSPNFKAFFPGQDFKAYPGLDTPENEAFPDLYKDVIKEMKPGNVVIIAIPDQLHHEAIKEALKNNQHILCVKPLVLKYSEAKEIEEEARRRGLFVGIEYHKRFDRRSLLAKKHYESGHLGEFMIGEAKLIEPYYYRNSNFQNWFLVENTDPFVYVGCHYFDLVQFITGLKPVEVSVRGIKGKFPNGNEGYLWSVGHVVYENGAILSITNGLGYPDDGAGSNEQCLSMYFEGNGKTGHLKHNDQFRGVEYSFLDGIGPGNSHFNYVNPDYFRHVPWQGPGLKPVGYGYDSIEANINAIHSIVEKTSGLDESKALSTRQKLLKEIDERGIIATPANSSLNELVSEAARLSISHDGKPVKIILDENPHVEFS